MAAVDANDPEPGRPVRATSSRLVAALMVALLVAVATAILLLAGCAGPRAVPERRGAPPPPDVAAALAGCSAAPMDRVTWRVHCGSAVAEVHDPFGETAPALLELAHARLVLVGGGRVEAAPAEVGAAGEWRRGERSRVLSTAASAAGRPRATGVAVTVPFGGERLRLAWCIALPAAVAPAAPTRCDAVLDALASLPWRAGVVRGRLPPELAGRPVLMPPGCEPVADPLGGDVACSATDGWRWRRLGQPKEIAPSDMEYADSAADAAKQVRPTEPIPEPPAAGRPCLVDGVATRCDVKEAWGGASVTVSTVATVRGAPLELTCTFFGSPDDLPAVCQGLEWGP